MCHKIIHYQCGAVETVFSKTCNCGHRVEESYSQRYCGICRVCNRRRA